MTPWVLGSVAVLTSALGCGVGAGLLIRMITPRG